MSERMSWVAFLLLVASLGIGAGTAVATPMSLRTKAVVSSVAVPTQFNELSTDESKLFISGYESTCVSQQVNTLTLRRQPGRRACSAMPVGRSVSISYRRVIPIAAYGSCRPESGAVFTVRVDQPTGRDVDGPVIMRFGGACSHQYPVWVYGGCSLWVYDPSTGPKENQGELVELSATTGAVEGSLTLPAMPAAVLAADDDGFYIGPGEFYQPGQGISHVLPGASHAQFLRRVPGPMASLYGFSHSMYAELQFDYAQPCTNNECQLWRFEGGSATATLLNAHLASVEQQPAGNAQAGILTTDPSTSAPYPTSFDVIRIDPSTGTTKILVLLKVPEDDFVESTAHLAGSLHVLVRGRLFRVPV